MNTRLRSIIRFQHGRIASRTDRMFVWLLPFQCLVAALLPFPAWSEMARTAAWGLLIAGVPVYLALSRPGRRLNRMAIAVAQMLFSLIFAHPFHVYGSLALLSLYKDWRPLGVATAITVIHALLSKGLTLPPGAVEHVVWVLFEDVFLLTSIRDAVQAMERIAERQLLLEQALSDTRSRAA